MKLNIFDRDHCGGRKGIKISIQGAKNHNILPRQRITNIFFYWMKPFKKNIAVRILEEHSEVYK